MSDLRAEIAEYRQQSGTHLPHRAEVAVLQAIPETLDLGDLYAGEGRTAFVRVLNRGTAPLRLSISQLDPALQVERTSLIIQSGSEDELRISLKTSTTTPIGVLAATLELRAQADTVGAPLLLTVQARVREAVTLVADIAEVDFGEVSVAGPPEERRVVLRRSDGTAARIGPTIQPTTPDAADPSLGHAFETRVDTNTAILHLHAANRVPGEYRGFLRFSDQDPDVFPLDLPFRVVFLAPPCLQLPDLDRTICLNDLKGELGVVAQNSGAGELRVRLDAVSPWLVAAKDEVTINPGEQRKLVVPYNLEGERTVPEYGELDIVSNDGGHPESRRRVRLLVMRAEPQVTIDWQRKSSLRPGRNQHRRLLIRNDGDGTARVRFVSAPAWLTLDTDSTVVVPSGRRALVSATVTPGQPGMALAGDVRFTDGGSSGRVQTVSVGLQTGHQRSSWAWYVGVLVVLLAGAQWRLSSGSPQQACASQMRQLVSAVRAYAADNEETLPPYDNWQGRIAPYLTRPNLLVCPAMAQLDINRNLSALALGWVSQPTSTGCGLETDFSRQPVYPHDDRMNVAFVDGHVRPCDRQQAYAIYW